MEQSHSLNAAQIRAARGLCDLSQADLAARAGVSAMSIKRAEGSGKPAPGAATLAAIQAALETAGVIFLAESDCGEGPGVRLRKP